MNERNLTDADIEALAKALAAQNAPLPTEVVAQGDSSVPDEGPEPSAGATAAPVQATGDVPGTGPPDVPVVPADPTVPEGGPSGSPSGGPTASEGASVVDPTPGDSGTGSSPPVGVDAVQDFADRFRLAVTTDLVSNLSAWLKEHFGVSL